MDSMAGGGAVPTGLGSALQRVGRAVFLLVACGAVAICGYGVWEGRWPWDAGVRYDLPGVAVIDRAVWGADPVRGPASAMERPTRITLHHSGAVEALDEPPGAAAQRIKSIQWDHQHDRGWIDIGYHFVVDGAGRIWAGRGLSQEGAHAGPRGANRANIGVLLLGNFDEQRPTPEQTASAGRLLEALRERFGIARRAVFSHDEVRRVQGLGATRCPGGALHAWLEDYRAAGETASVVAPSGQRLSSAQ